MRRVYGNMQTTHRRFVVELWRELCDRVCAGRHWAALGGTGVALGGIVRLIASLCIGAAQVHRCIAGA